MSLYETHYDAHDATYRIVCEDAASGLDGIDGKAWLFSVSDEDSSKTVNVQAGFTSDLLAAWQEHNGGVALTNAELIPLLGERIKLDIAQENIDPDVVEDTEQSILTTENAAASFAEERRGLERLL